MPEEVLREVFSQCLSALNHSHSMNVAHRDVKLENILVDENYNIQIADWGLASPTQERSTKIVGTQENNPPEMLQYVLLYPEVQKYLNYDPAFTHKHPELK